MPTRDVALEDLMPLEQFVALALVLTWLWAFSHWASQWPQCMGLPDLRDRKCNGDLLGNHGSYDWAQLPQANPLSDARLQRV